MAIRSPELVEYGIQTEKSHLRCHVCFVVGKWYWFKTSSGAAAIKHASRQAEARQRGIVTARGYLVKPSRIDGCMPRDLEVDILKCHWVASDADESAKGAAAQSIVTDMLRRDLGRDFMEVNEDVEEVTDRVRQLEGTDIVLYGTSRVQVKCDYRGGEGRGGTGNLYLQTHECNPFGKH